MKMKKNSVESWLTIIKVAIDPNSPFKGLVDLRGIFKLVFVNNNFNVFNSQETYLMSF